MQSVTVDYAAGVVASPFRVTIRPSETIRFSLAGNARPEHRLRITIEEAAYAVFFSSRAVQHPPGGHAADAIELTARPGLGTSAVVKYRCDLLNADGQLLDSSANQPTGGGEIIFLLE